MEAPHLSLAPTQFIKTDDINSSSNKLQQTSSSCSRKRKLLLHHHHSYPHHINSQTSVDLQLKDPLPLDWEQCLDLQSGKMYYLNRKTLRKSWNWPEEDHHNDDKKLDLELELNNIDSSSSKANSLMNFRHGYGSSSSQSSNMVALPCLNCHLLVILSKSSPSCPNCKHFHALFPIPSSPNSPPPNTLSLLN
ncbi:uncharacterized protein LOC111807358 [Cucurbita pepo subsp. pepo]|uniref:uncharacterized protein LOC111807358 n=1 Tax=Cucurbita pepo subsp. pepo TaxID=3664 RepID=UPI000C9D8127|nr:uncharacterized protein LOC111807358 [Cucurbita pepo subsp. pepo]